MTRAIRPARVTPRRLRILVERPSAAGSCLPPDALRLDESHVSAALVELSETDPYFHRGRAAQRLQTLARRLGRHMALAFEGGWSAPREMIAEALHFQLSIQLCTIVPLRRLARALVRSANGRALLVALPRLDLACLGFWDVNQLEPLILCWALQREGGNAFLLYTGPPNGADLRLTLRPSPTMLPPRGPNPSDLPALKGRPLLAPEGIRSLDVVGQDVEAPVLVAGALLFSALPSPPLLHLLEPSDPDPTMEITFRREEHALAGVDQVSVEWPADPLARCFDDLVGPLFRAIVGRVRALLLEAETTEAHVCDHLFLGSTILAHEVRRRGGRVTLWPHSANPIDIDVRGGHGFDEVVTITRAAGAAWTRRFPRKPGRLRPRIMLPPPRPGPGVDASAPLTLIVFGGTHASGRLPMLRVERHLETYRRFFARLSAATAFARLRFKAKGNRRAAVDWLRDNGVVSSPPYEIETGAPTRLDHPNMIYLTIDYGSTALLEGIACGVPCMIVREQAIVDYAMLPDAVVPIGDVETIWACIARCREPDHYDRLRRSQIDWLIAETALD